MDVATAGKYYHLYGSAKKRKKEEDEEEKEEEQNKKLTLLKLRSLKEGTRALGKWQCLSGCWYLILQNGPRGLQPRTPRKVMIFPRVHNEAGSESISKTSKWNQLLLLE